jgi:hypothetical protein
VANYVALAEGKNEFVTNENKKRNLFDGLNFIESLLNLYKPEIHETLWRYRI